MTRDVMSRLAAARPPQLDPTADPSRRARDLQRAVAGAPEPGVRRRSPARGPIRWTALGVGLVSAAAAVTVVVSGSGSTPAGPPAAGHPASVDTQTLSGQQVLLVAANNAERQPATDGRYWRVRMLREVGEHQAIHESWYGKDGYYWEGRLVLKGHGGASEPPSMYKEKQRSSRPFSMSDQGFTLNEIRALPTTVKGIEKWAEGIARSVSPNWREKDIDGFATGLLIQLLAQAPALPKTRAAAFRALAGRPGMESVGKAKDAQGRTGYAFREGSIQHLVDPTTAVLLASTSTLPKRHTGTTYLRMGWTNESPSLISGL